MLNELPLTAEEIARRGEDLYERGIRAKVDRPENRGKFVVIDIDTGAFEVDDEDLAATERLLARNPGTLTYGLRVGDDVAYDLGGHIAGSAG